MTNHRFAVIHQHNTLDLTTLADTLSHLSDNDLPSDAMHIKQIAISYSETTGMHTLKLTITDTRANDPWLITIRLHPALNKWFTVQPLKSQTNLHIECGLELSIFCYYPRDKNHHIDDPSTDSVEMIKAIACTLSKQQQTPSILELPNVNLIVYTNGEYIKAFEHTNLSR